jgi:hypothetical protein
MDKTQIIIFAAAMAILAIRLYQKYVKKNKINSGTDTKPSASGSMPSSLKDEEYEPYSKK